MRNNRVFGFIYLLFLALSIPVVNCSLLGIDYGAEWVKVSSVRPGAALDIMLNSESKRKTPSVVVIRDDTIHLGSSTSVQGTKFPQDTFRFAKNLIGKKFTDPIVEQYINSYHVQLVSDDARGGLVAFNGTDGKIWSIEEIIAIQLKHIRQEAEIYAYGDPVGGAVVTVPPYFGLIEREVILSACKLADIPVLSLVSDGAAVSLNYANTHKSFPEPELHIFYDTGSTGTTVSLIRFNNGDSEKAPNNPLHLNVNIDVLGVAFNPKFGGHNFDLAVRDLLIETIKTSKGESVVQQIKSNPRAMAKLLKESVRVKQILSANSECHSSIEGLLPEIDYDFKGKINRKDLESQIIEGLEDTVKEPIEKVLKDAGKKLEDVKSVVLVGGHLRVPIVLQTITELVGAERIAKNINADEAAALGAGLYAASLRGYRVGNIKLRDANTMSVELKYPTTSPLNETAEIGTFGGLNKTLIFGVDNSDDSATQSILGEIGSRQAFYTNFTTAHFVDPASIPSSFDAHIKTYISGLIEADEEFKSHSVSEFSINVYGIIEAVAKLKTKLGFQSTKEDATVGDVPNGDIVVYAKTYITLTRDGVLDIASTLFARRVPKVAVETKESGIVGNIFGKIFGSKSDETNGEENEDEDSNESTSSEEATTTSVPVENKNGTNGTNTESTTTEKPKPTYPASSKAALKVSIKYEGRRPLNQTEYFQTNDKLHELALIEKRRKLRADKLNTLETIFYSLNDILEDKETNSLIDVKNFKVSIPHFIFEDPFNLKLDEPDFDFGDLNMEGIKTINFDKLKKKNKKKEPKEVKEPLEKELFEVVGSFRDYMDAGKHFNAAIEEISEQLHQIESAVKSLHEAKLKIINEAKAKAKAEAQAKADAEAQAKADAEAKTKVDAETEAKDNENSSTDENKKGDAESKKDEGQHEEL